VLHSQDEAAYIQRPVDADFVFLSYRKKGPPSIRGYDQGVFQNKGRVNLQAIIQRASGNDNHFPFGTVSDQGVEQQSCRLILVQQTGGKGLPEEVAGWRGGIKIAGIRTLVIQ